jgi:excisionase family DNA binding protein
MSAKSAPVLEAEKAYTIAQVAEMKNVSQGYVRKAINATKGPSLAAKKVGKGYRISASALEEWWASLPDG